MLEALETLPPKTIDNLYFWESKYPQFDDLIMYMLTLLFQTNYGFFKELLNSVIFASTVEVEEAAYHFHRARLEDHAVPDYYDALEIYKSIAPDEFAKKSISEKADEDQSIPSFALALLPDDELFARVVKRIEEPSLVEMLQVEMAALANKVVVADQVPPDNPGAMRRAVEKALAYINLGLELRSGANIERAAEVVRNNFLEHLFRLAQADVAKIKGRLRSIVLNGWLRQCPAGLKCLDGEWYDAAEELLAKTPRIQKSGSGGSASGSSPEYGFFRTPLDLAKAVHLVSVIRGAGEIYKLLGADMHDCGQRLWADGQIRSPEDITLGVMVLTAAANSLISGTWRVEPLLHSAWPEVFPLLQPRALGMAIMDWVRQSVPDREKRILAETYLLPVIRDYDLEMCPFSAQTPPEARLVKYLMFSE